MDVLAPDSTSPREEFEQWRLREDHFELELELELELIQSQMAAQKPMLRGEVGARALRVRSVSRG